MVTTIPVIDIILHPIQGQTTTCMLSIVINGLPVWPVAGEPIELEIQIDDLLSYLTDFWKSLMHKQGFPIGINPDRPSQLRAEARRRWSELSQDIVDTEEQIVCDFEEAHNLSYAFSGLYGLPPFWMMRLGNQMLMETRESLWNLPLDDVQMVLSQRGDWICERLKTADFVRWETAIAAWQKRKNRL
jgi:hypothetical protein